MWRAKRGKLPLSFGQLDVYKVASSLRKCAKDICRSIVCYGYVALTKVALLRSPDVYDVCNGYAIRQMLLKDDRWHQMFQAGQSRLTEQMLASSC